MRKGNSFWLNIIYFLAGALISYIFSQWQLLKIELEVNVTETIMAAITAVVGLYIAVSLQTRHSRNQNLYNYLQSKLDNSWQSFNALAKHLEIDDQIEVATVTKTVKEVYQNISSLKLILNSYNHNDRYIAQIEKEIDDLEGLLVSNQTRISNNIIFYSNSKATVISYINQVHSSFAVALREINQFS